MALVGCARMRRTSASTVAASVNRPAKTKYAVTMDAGVSAATVQVNRKHALEERAYANRSAPGSSAGLMDAVAPAAPATTISHVPRTSALTEAAITNSTRSTASSTRFAFWLAKPTPQIRATSATPKQTLSTGRYKLTASLAVAEMCAWTEVAAQRLPTAPAWNAVMMAVAGCAAPAPKASSASISFARILPFATTETASTGTAVPPAR